MQASIRSSFGSKVSMVSVVRFLPCMRWYRRIGNSHLQRCPWKKVKVINLTCCSNHKFIVVHYSRETMYLQRREMEALEVCFMNSKYSAKLLLGNNSLTVVWCHHHQVLSVWHTKIYVLYMRCDAHVVTYKLQMERNSSQVYYFNPCTYLTKDCFFGGGGGGGRGILRLYVLISTSYWTFS